MLVRKEQRQIIQNVKAIPGEFQHSLVVEDIDKKRFEEKVIKIFDVGAPMGTFQG